MKIYFLLYSMTMIHLMVAMEGSETLLRLKATLERENNMRQEYSTQLAKNNEHRKRIEELEGHIKALQKTSESEQTQLNSMWGIAQKGIPYVFTLALGAGLGYYCGINSSCETKESKKTK